MLLPSPPDSPSLKALFGPPWCRNASTDIWIAVKPCALRVSSSVVMSAYFSRLGASHAVSAR